MEHYEDPLPEIGAMPSGTIHRTAMMQSSILSSNTIFHNDGDTEFAATVPEVEEVPNQELPDGTINISDSALSAVVINSEDTVIDHRGARTNIQIGATGNGLHSGTCQPESDTTQWYDPTPRSDTGINASNSVLLNTVVGSSDTKINMEGAQIRIKRKKKRASERKAPQPGHINIDNSAALSLVANSRGTHVTMTNADISIE